MLLFIYVLNIIVINNKEIGASNRMFRNSYQIKHRYC